MTTIEEEARAAYAKFIATRDEAEAQRPSWDALADFYTDDRVTIDHSTDESCPSGRSTRPGPTNIPHCQSTRSLSHASPEQCVRVVAR